VEVPETRFTWVGDDRIAYQVFGDGPVVLVEQYEHEVKGVPGRWPLFEMTSSRVGAGAPGGSGYSSLCWLRRRRMRSM
jgi:hypothetical protein